MQIPKLNAELSLLPSAKIYRGELSPQSLFSTESNIVPQACSWSGGPETVLGESLDFASVTGGKAEYIYAIGAVRPLFPSLSIEKEFFQAADIEYLKGYVSQDPGESFVYQVLNKSENLYIAREMIWVFQIVGIDLYIVKPSSNRELTRLVGSIAHRKGTTDLDVIIGSLGPISRPEEYNGLKLPIVACGEAYCFTYKEMIDEIIKTTKATEPEATEVFSHMIELTDNLGLGDADRAINFVTLNYMQVYQIAVDMLKGGTSEPKDPKGFSLINVMTKSSRIQGNQRVLDVIFTYLGNSTNVKQKWYCRVDVTKQFPFLVSGMARYYDRP
jgi:hypothetical protein